jgi:hypothetical protein
MRLGRFLSEGRCLIRRNCDMNTAFGLFNLAVAIRTLRPDDNNDQRHEDGLSEETALTPIDYSLLTNRSVGAEYVFERSASATGKGVGQCWATLKNRNLSKVVRWGAFEALKSA